MEIYKFKEVVSIINGKNQKQVEDANGLYPIYGSGGIIGYANDFLCPENTVIIGRKGSINKPFFVNQKIWNVDTAFGLVSNPKILLPQFLYYFCVYFNFDKLNTTVTIPSLTKSNILNIDIRIPSIGEQRKITARLNKLDNIISLKISQLSKLDQLVKSRFIEMFGDPASNPYRWELATVEDVCSSIVRGPFGSALKKEFFVKPDNTTYEVYEQKNAIQKSATIGTYYINREKYYELRRFECFPGDILMSCSGTMGELYQLPPTSEKGIINQALCKFTLNDKILPVFFLTYMKETIGNLEVKGSGIQNIAAVSYVKAMPINLPPISVQKQFATFCAQVDKSKLPVKQSLEKLETLKKSLMQEYFG